MNPRGTLILRPALAREAPALAEMSRELIETGLAWRYTPRRKAALIGDPDTVTLVACEAQRIQGMAVMQFGDEHAHLSLLCVEPQQQLRGIGRRLTEWLVASSQVAGMALIGLELRADNESALAFYRRLAFIETELLPGYYDQRIAARRMVRRLRSDAAAS